MTVCFCDICACFRPFSLLSSRGTSSPTAGASDDPGCAACAVARRFPMLIWIASYPRSGNRFFRTVARVRYGLPERAKLAAPPETDPNYHILHSLAAVLATPQPVMVKTHELPDDDRHPAVYVLRDGRDAMVSYTHFALKVHDKLDPVAITPEQFRSRMRELLLEERSAYGSWGENVLAWSVRPATVLVRYEDMVRDPAGEVDRALAAIGCPAPRISAEVPTFGGMKQENAKLVRRGVPGSWKDEFPTELLPLFWQRNGDVMRNFGYTDGQLNAA